MIGQKIQNYQIDALLGQGGMGTVYRATDTLLGRAVALKMLHTNLTKQSQFLERFKNEAQVLAQLTHPNIAVLYNYLQQGDAYYMVMEYVPGKNIEALVKQHFALPPRDAVGIILQALEGLGHAHKKGILHRDIKPANLMLTPDGMVKLMDFGIAKVSGEQRLTQVNRVVGTLEFMAPELIQGKDPSVASDVYGMGVTMYEMLSGRLPFEGKTDYSLMQDIVHKQPTALDVLDKTFPKALNQVVMKALAKNPADRFIDAKDFSKAIEKIFPQNNPIDLNLLQNSATAIAVTQFADLQTELHTEEVSGNTPEATTNMATVEQGAFQTQLLQPLQSFKTDWKAWLQENWHIPSSAILVVLAMVFTWKAIFPSEPKKEPKDSTQVVVSSGNTGGSVSGGTSGGSTGGGGTINPQPDDDDNTNNKNIVPEIVPKPDPNNKKPKKPAEEHKPDNHNTKKEEVVPKPKESDPPKEDRKPEPENRKVKSVFIPQRLEVDLYLLSDIDLNNAQEGQALSFKVQNPVIYNGVTIIQRGASASGYIKKISLKKISLAFNTVTSVSGQQLPFHATELSGKFEEMLQSKSYTVSLEKNITANF